MSGPIVLLLRVLLALALYAFLGSAFWLLSRDLRRAARDVTHWELPSIGLEIRGRKGSAIRRSFTQREVLLGRDPHCDLRIANRSVSARHALLSFHDGQWWLNDLESTNGTRLNRRKVIGPTVLTSGDEIECGVARLVVHATDAHMAQDSQTVGQQNG